MIKVRWAPYRHFPYEKELGRREVAALTKAYPQETGAGLEIEGNNPELERSMVERLRQQSTYFSRVLHDESEVLADQAQVETQHWRLRGGERRRQSTRFAVHGLHEYKGKFNPQMARALLNVVDP